MALRGVSCRRRAAGNRHRRPAGRRGAESPDLPLESRYRAYGAKYGAYRVRPRASVQPPAREHGCRYLGLEESSDWNALQARARNAHPLLDERINKCDPTAEQPLCI